MSMGLYVLDEDGNPRATEDSREWGEMFKGERHVAKTEIELAGQKGLVSTVFLGIDHNYSGEGPPLLFETMVFLGDGNDDDYCDRHATRAEAEAGHAAALASYTKRGWRVLRAVE